MRAIVIGAGIGGLTAAIALREAGVEPVVFERAAELRAVGAGVVLAANAVRVLGALGLAGEALRLGAAASAVQIRSWRGEILADAPAAELERRLGAPSAAIHRADLQRLLLRDLGEERVRLGATCVGFAQDAAGVTAAFADGSEARGDVLIGADGLRSTIRARLFGEERPRYAGYAAWRAVVRPDRDPLPSGVGFEAWGCGARFGCVPIGGGRVYWFAVRNAPEGAEDGPPGSPTGPMAALLGCFGGWGSWVPELIATTDERAIRRDDIHDRPPLTGPWGAGRVTLLGDAAHPMTPNLGQGACQAIEDAATLARCLAEGDAADPAAALRRYEDQRRSRVSWIVRRSRAFGRVGQIDTPLLCRLRDAALKATPTALQVRQLERVIGGGDPPAAAARATHGR